MLKLKATEIFDLNIIGLLFIVVVAILILFFQLDWVFVAIVEVTLVVYAWFLNSKINKNRAISIVVNSENQWFIERDQQLYAMSFKDYWLFSSRIFICLKGKKNSVSFVVTRSIIGAQNFSQLHAKIL